ncbi:hypothetical protein [Nakamurella multipartita]|uniref:Uncharacterized protein n=1 Tax=Nakamurella multipartita (strain ATCC 700099 / DSM 44233 / CIP 104796 / JCM 9543 / NBRC 105858 / Y-104) TaxID=479431 RepID=C8X6H2_NAKMY|nr:hypothetical protein [Nakamurella multipartita]ACV78827.1 hypothetical protein Namu_2458 [Nakamurella multipartita DSM 44233]
MRLRRHPGGRTDHLGPRVVLGVVVGVGPAFNRHVQPTAGHEFDLNDDGANDGADDRPVHHKHRQHRLSGTTAGAAGTDLTGDVYGKIVAVDPGQSQITLDKFDWFTGDAARQACDEDGVQERDNGWCTDYYYRNRNPQLRVVTVSPDATVVTLAGGSPTPVPSDLPTVGQRLSGSESSGIFQITVTDGQVTSIRELYFP